MPKRLTVPLLMLAFCVAAPAAALVMAHHRQGDRDHDGLPDRWERRYHISTKQPSARRDPDHDELNNRREYRAHTNPRRADTDRDGLSDYAELVRWRTNPRRTDTDGDGFSDRAEVRAGTNPRSRASHPRMGSSPSSPRTQVRQTDCSAKPDIPGGRDPFGGCFPGSSNTGVPRGTVLSNYAGPCIITTANTVIDSKTVNCTLLIQAAGVQIRNSKINGRVYIDEHTKPYSFSITDSELDQGGPGGDSTGKSHFVLTRVNVHGGFRGVWCENDCTVQDSWIHGQARDPSGVEHESAVRMGDGSRIVHNSLLCDAPDVPPDAGCSADLTGYGDFAPIRNNTIQKNLFVATTGGACAYGGSSGDDGSKPFGKDAANIVFKDNIFQRGREGKCGVWFPISDFDRSRPGNEWLNNRWDNGGSIPPA